MTGYVKTDNVNLVREFTGHVKTGKVNLTRGFYIYISKQAMRIQNKRNS